MFYHNPHKCLNQFLEDDLAGYLLGNFDDSCKVQVLDRRSNHGRGTEHRQFLPQVRVNPVELLHFTVSAPAEIAMPCVPQIGVREGLESACAIKPCCAPYTAHASAQTW